MHNGKNHQIRIFLWTIGFNPKEETSRAAVWILFPNMSTDLFDKRTFHSIDSAFGKPIVVDKATEVRSRPGTARVRVIPDLMDKHPDRIQLQSVDKVTSRIIVEFQDVVSDNLPQYCTHYKHQGHDEKKSDKYANATTRCKLDLSLTCLVLKLLMATLDASACEIPSPSTESIGEKWDDFGHKLLFKGNEQDVDGVVVLTPMHSNNKVEAKSDQKRGTNLKSWADMAEEEKQASSPPTCSKLSPTISEFVPSYAMTKRHEPGDLLEDPMEEFEGDLGVDIFGEEDEDEVLNECIAKVARDGDLSPRQQRKGFKKKKTHERKHS
ncbi:hypothetical protein BC332_27900 [Capsicum chinense]|nr:hypothetical protein BC332_27900 [Capsicum chinense]